MDGATDGMRSLCGRGSYNLEVVCSLVVPEAEVEGHPSWLFCLPLSGMAVPLRNGQSFRWSI